MSVLLWSFASIWIVSDYSLRSSSSNFRNDISHYQSIASRSFSTFTISYSHSTQPTMYTFVMRNTSNDDSLGSLSASINASSTTSDASSDGRKSLHDIQNPYPPEKPWSTHPSRTQVVFGVALLFLVLLAFGYGVYITWKKLVNEEGSHEGKITMSPELSKVASLSDSEELELDPTKKKPSTRPKLIVRFALDGFPETRATDTPPRHSDRGRGASNGDTTVD